MLKYGLKMVFQNQKTVFDHSLNLKGKIINSHLIKNYLSGDVTINKCQEKGAISAGLLVGEGPHFFIPDYTQKAVAFLLWGSGRYRILRRIQDTRTNDQSFVACL